MSGGVFIRRMKTAVGRLLFEELEQCILHL